MLPTTDTETNKVTRFRACGRAVLILLPVQSCALILASLYLLAYRPGVTKGHTISKWLSRYEPKAEVLAPVCTGATLSFIIMVMRNIQIDVHHRRRKGKSRCVQATNLVATVTNALAYAGFVLLAVFDSEGAGARSRVVHLAGGFAFFILTGVYGLLHAFLLCAQGQHPTHCKVAFAIIPLTMISCLIVFVLTTSKKIRPPPRKMNPPPPRGSIRRPRVLTPGRRAG